MLSCLYPLACCWFLCSFDACEVQYCLCPCACCPSIFRSKRPGPGQPAGPQPVPRLDRGRQLAGGGQHRHRLCVHPPLLGPVAWRVVPAAVAGVSTNSCAECLYYLLLLGEERERQRDAATRLQSRQQNLMSYRSAFTCSIGEVCTDCSARAHSSSRVSS